jgi:hypothetical protein
VREGKDAAPSDDALDVLDDDERDAPGRDDAPVPAPRRRVLRALLIVLVLAAGAFAVGTYAGRSDSAVSGDAEPTTTAPVRLERATHVPGDCVTWNQDAGSRPAPRAVATVPCDEPHLVEITGHIVIAERLDHVPGDDELDALTDRLCLPVNESHLGRRLDPNGRYFSAGIQPSAEGWRAGDRETWCALGAHDGTEDGTETSALRPFRGKVSGASQYWRYEPGTCLVVGRKAPVPCAQDHDVEVVGRVELTDRSSVPALGDYAGWDAIVGAACKDRVRAYLAREPAALLTAGWFGIPTESWTNGLRTVTCLVGERDAGSGDWTSVRGSVRSISS